MRLKLITLMVSLTTLFANASSAKHLIKTNLTYYTTDLTKEGTHPLDKNDSFVFDGLRDYKGSKPIWYKGGNYFFYDSAFYKSDGTMSGTTKFYKDKSEKSDLFKYRDKLCYYKIYSSDIIYSLDYKGKKIELFDLYKQHIRINKIVLGVYGDRFLILTFKNELWLSPTKDDNKILSFLGKLPNNNLDSDIFVTNKFIYFYSKDDMPSKILYIKNAKTTPQKVEFKYFNFPKNVIDIIADNKNLYFLNSKGFVYKINGTKVSNKPINKIAIKTNGVYSHYGNIFMGILDGYILYSVDYKDSISIETDRYTSKLYKMNLETGEQIKLSENKFDRFNGIACHSLPPLPEPKRPVKVPQKAKFIPIRRDPIKPKKMNLLEMEIEKESDY